MIKSLRFNLYRYLMTLGCLISFAQLADAQTDADAIMIPKNVVCLGGMYSYSSWTNYWEGTFKRDNLNIGKLTTNMYGLGAVYGITNKLDISASAPYITTNASAGTLHGEKGLQDITVYVKWAPYQTEIGRGIFSVDAILEGSTPLSNYEDDFLPVSIGLHSTTASLRALVNYQLGRFFIAAAGQYTQRGDITIDQNAYYTTQEIYSNRVYMPNQNNFLISAGFRSLKFNAEAVFSQTTTLGGFDIRKNDMPFPSNTMNSSVGGIRLKYSVGAETGLEFEAGGNYVLAGRNVGQATTVWGGVLYLFDISKKTK